jgi:predicted O-methyltransferase YrrM
MLSDKEFKLTDEAFEQARASVAVHINLVFNIMRILKKLNPGDTYYECYLGHLQKAGPDFYDTYLLLTEIGARMAPKRILEIGTRTGISLCQLLSSYLNHSVIERIVSVDPFPDGFASVNLVKKNLNYLNLPADKVEFMEMKSEEAIPILTAAGESFDLIIVDGDHSKDMAYFDLLGADMLINEGGVIVFDDISPDGCDLLDVWERFQRRMAPAGQYLFAEPKMGGKGVAWCVRNFDEKLEDEGGAA